MAKSHLNPSLKHLKPNLNRKIINPTIITTHHRNLYMKKSSHANIVIIINILQIDTST